MNSDSHLNSTIAAELPPYVEGETSEGLRRLLRAVWSNDIISTCLIALDAAAIVTAGLAAHALTAPTVGIGGRAHLAAAVLTAIVVGQFNFQFGLYNLARAKRAFPTADRLLLSLLMSCALLSFAAHLAGVDALQSTWGLLFAGLSAVTLVGSRLSFNFVVTRLGRARVLNRNVVIVGAGDHGLTLLKQLQQGQRPWVHVVGMFDDRVRDASERVQRIVGDQTVVGSCSDLVAFSRQVRVDDIFIALPWTAGDRIRAILDQVRVIPASIHVAPDLLTGHFERGKYSTLDGMSVITLADKPDAVVGWGFLMKWLLDKSATLLGLLLIAPLLGLIALAIRIDSPGPILFRQKRLGFNHQTIEILKFRSMYHEQQDANAETLVTAGDSRVTPIGRFLRQYSLDELPQLVNVLRGDMSLVGPRPHALRAKAGGRLYQDIVSEYALRHKMKPGITGWAQVNGWRGETDTSEKLVRRVEHDLNYIDNWSIFFDLYILFLTVFSASARSNAH